MSSHFPEEIILSAYCRSLVAGALALIASLGGAQAAEDAATAAATAAAAPISIELNKLEPQGQGCRAYVVVDNKSDVTYSTLKLDLIVFGTDGVIARRNALDLGPVRASKKSIKTFDLDNPPCDGIGSVLVNDVLECKSAEQSFTDCLDRMSASSRASAPFTK